MRRIAVISDIHSNLTALEAVLAEASSDGADEVWCLGDVVGYGPDPLECQHLVEASCSIILAGNHDHAVTGRIDSRWFNDAARAGVAHSRARLEHSERAIERADARHPEINLPGGIVLAHGTPSPFDAIGDYAFADVSPDEILAARPEAQLVLVGHLHHQLLAFTTPGDDPAVSTTAGPGASVRLDGVRAVINPGSVGQPRDRDPRAAWGMLELSGDGRPVSFSWRRTEYDAAAVAERIRTAGLPEWLGDRLIVGA